MVRLKLKPEHLRQLLDILQRHTPEAEVWAYGSRVNGGAHDGSDLDLVVRDPVGLDQPQKQMCALREALSESNLPILVDVLDWARLPEHFRQEIERQHVIVRAVAAAPANSRHA
jgi:predicted nucleotidyltransferase